METKIFANILSMIILILIISGTFMLSKKTKIMFEILLVLSGMVLVSISYLIYPSLTQYLHLDANMLLYGFLPILLLQIAYTMPYKDIIRNIHPIWLLAVVSPVVSALAIGGIIYVGARWMWYDIPFLITLLFGTIMSSTDPVTVLSIFQKIGAPRKLILFFEWESLFNDGASLALFFLVLSWLIGERAHVTLFDGLVREILGKNIILGSTLSFVSTILGGILLWTVSGILFSKLLHWLRQHQYLAILIIVISAYSTFLATDIVHTYIFPASSIIATIFSTFIIGNYGRFKLDIQTEKLAESSFAFVAFLVNSIIFLFIGASILQIKIELLIIFGWLIPVIIVGVIAWRALSVYLPFGLMNLWEQPSEKIPFAWQHVLAWGSLRGGLALALVALIPSGASFIFLGNLVNIQDFLWFLVIFSVLFSIFVKTLTLEGLIKKLGINQLSTMEKIEEEEIKLITIASMLQNIERMYEQKSLSLRERDYLLGTYKNRKKEILERCSTLVKKSPESYSAFSKILSLYALALERHFAKELYQHGDLTEKPLKRFLAIIDVQAYRLRSGKTQIREIFQKSYKNDVFERLVISLTRLVQPDTNPLFTEYAILRARVIILDQTIRSLKELYDLAKKLWKTREYERVENLYLDFQKKALQKQASFNWNNAPLIPGWQEKILQKTFKKLEELVIEDLSKKELISDRFTHILKVQQSDFEGFLGQYTENLILMEKMEAEAGRYGEVLIIPPARGVSL